VVGVGGGEAEEVFTCAAGQFLPVALSLSRLFLNATLIPDYFQTELVSTSNYLPDIRSRTCFLQPSGKLSHELHALPPPPLHLLAAVLCVQGNPQLLADDSLQLVVFGLQLFDLGLQVAKTEFKV